MDLFDMTAKLTLDASSFEQGVSRAAAAIRQLASTVNSVMSGVSSAGYRWGSDLIGNFISGVNARMGELQAKIAAVAGMVHSFVGFSEPERGPLSDFHTYAPDMMALFAEGIAENAGIVRRQVEKSFDFSDVLPGAPTVRAAEGEPEKTDRTAAITGILETYLPMLAERQLVTDTGALVGALTPYLDESLGRMEAMRESGLA
ncbi:MAG: hypothetical protein IJJ85_08440 [Clostridia bacterium]|nr:hypothetical protein [Clostridia bacterium]